MGVGRNSNHSDEVDSAEIASREDELLWGDASLSPRNGRASLWGRGSSVLSVPKLSNQAIRSAIPDWLFIFELANNHMGDVDHGVKIVHDLAVVAKDFRFHFAVKLQYRALDTFIHPNYKGRADIKYIKRFEETRLSRAESLRLIEAIRSNGFLAVCTPFDEDSVDRVVEDGFDILKIASCSLTDWPLLERAAATHLPMIVSTAGSSVADIDSVVAYLRHRKKDFMLMHCVAEYPSQNDRLQLNQIDFLRHRYDGVRIGYSTHESPSAILPVAIAIGKGCTVFEKHVGLSNESYEVNDYSANPGEVRAWLEAASEARSACGVAGRRSESTPEEKQGLFALRRGAFAKHDIKAGQKIDTQDVFMAIPTQPGHVTANEWSKYTNFTATADIGKDDPILDSNTRREDVREKVWAIVQEVKSLLSSGNVVIPGAADLEISHHYGIDRFHEFGITMITVVNREYCKKLIVVLPGQKHPEQFHNHKEETFHVLHGVLDLTLNGIPSRHGPGDVITVERTTRHAFTSETGAILEEISSTHYQDDSFYTDPSIAENKDRKTFVTHWM